MKRSLLLIPALLVLAGCASPASVAVDPSSGAEAVSFDNCGFDLTLDAAPERIVTIKSTSTELLLALGLGNRIIGTAFQDGPLPSSLAPSTSLKEIAPQMPSEEALLDLEPDFVYAGWESAFTPDAAGDRDELADLGIGTYVSPAACKEAEYKPAKLTFDDLFDEITEAGRVFGADSEASDLIADQKEQLATVEADTTGKSVLWWSSGDDTPYVGAGIGAPQMMLEQLGLTNIAADVNDTWSPLSWEAIVAANPDVIVLVDASWNTAAAKKEFLATNPATANITAVKNQAYLVIPFPAAEAGVRSVPATVDLASQLKAL